MRELFWLSVCAICLFGMILTGRRIFAKPAAATNAAGQPAADENFAAGEVHWDLSVFYDSPDDPQLAKDIQALVERSEAFGRYKGKLDSELGPALREYAEISMLEHKIFGYLQLLFSTQMDNERIKGMLADVQLKASQAQGEHMTFFDLELARLPDEAIEAQAARDGFVRKHRPYVEDIRRDRPHLLSEEVEKALAKRSPFGTGAWADYYDEVTAALRFEWKGEQKTLEQMLDLAYNNPSAETRVKASRVLNDGLKGKFAKLSAQVLYMVVGSKQVSDKDRGYRHPMHARNKSNKMSDATVEALHQAVLETGAPLTQRYYRLKAALLGQERLLWSDRNAPLPIADTSRIPFDQATTMVLDAYRDFSPSLAAMVEDMVRQRRIDAPMGPAKQSGAFNYSLVLPGNRPITYTLLNYKGTARSVMTYAHEVGHGVHGLLAGAAQGVLMYHAPTAYCETASIFGEMTVFERLKEKLRRSGDKEALLALLCGKIDDILNSVVRQISFSNFEREVHNAGRRLTVEELNAIWLKVTEQMYGQNGQIFVYDHHSHLWTYVHHFHRPFYVYSYAFGELLVDSLYAQRQRLGERFEPLYLDLLRSGDTKDASGLLAPFGLDPTDPAFFKQGLQIGIGAMVEEAEQLARELGYRF